MDGEYYQIDVVFDVAMSMHNYERGNLYLQSEFKSYKQGIKPLTLSRSGFLDPKSTFWLNLKELISMIPFVDFFFPCASTE